MMQALISPISLEEALIVAEGGADIIDIKNIKEGSLGASFPWIISEVVKNLKPYDVLFSATLGDLPFKPGTASLAALGAAAAGAQYIKAGLYDVANEEQGVEMMVAIRRACKDYDPKITVVTAGYADYRRFNGLDTDTLVRIAERSKSDLVMVDTAIKDGATLFDAMTLEEIRKFVDAGHKAGLKVALAGSVRTEHLPALQEVNADVIGVRGAVCGKGASLNDRKTGIERDRVRSFMETLRQGAKQEAKFNRRTVAKV
jgi:(5-formylfuran-3-yl)methyl phosphate synthase